MKTRQILVASGVASALLLALVSFNLMGEDTPAPVVTGSSTEPGARRLAPRHAAAKTAIRQTGQAVSGDSEAAKAAWLEQHFGPDLNADPAAGDAPVARPQAPAPSPLPAEGTPERFELELQRTAELFPDTKEFIDAMKEDIAVAQHNSNLSQPVPKPAP